jgi:hypothetical protein
MLQLRFAQNNKSNGDQQSFAANQGCVVGPARGLSALPMRVRLLGGVGEIGGSEIWKDFSFFLKPSSLFSCNGDKPKGRKKTGEPLSSRGARLTSSNTDTYTDTDLSAGTGLLEKPS